MQSLDPFANVDPKRQHEWEQRRAAMAARIESEDGDEEVSPALFIEALELMREQESIPRRVVFHPSAIGRELAWSMARIDFWFNDIDGLASEAKASTGADMPEEFSEIPIELAQTWQFHERPGAISIEPAAQVGGAARLVVRSVHADSQVAPKSRYAVAMSRARGRSGRRPAARRSRPADAAAAQLARAEPPRLPAPERFPLKRSRCCAGPSRDRPSSTGKDWPSPQKDRLPDRIVIGEGPQLPPRKPTAGGGPASPR